MLLQSGISGQSALKTGLKRLKSAHNRC
uniref:Uncharacterized protein n=1 Tax=Anguilla anguilla TaxID=7936 RepID=A0A0E9PBG5_ANGAN